MDRRTECDCYMPSYTDCRTEEQSVTAIYHPTDRRTEGQSVTAICHPIQTNGQKNIV
ncbi:hypothetical protein DPMN_179082 [Dreissena polymorpha]|uniref:Uncharacterized protein n=1 Tax=Dreissena polymorpha TaxID=45954 RepID=A0A9D4ILT5_DREPO|nr:hypothetical protein DPMN_179082 [Dreissena polymorpha]